MLRRRVKQTKQNCTPGNVALPHPPARRHRTPCFSQGNEKEIVVATRYSKFRPRPPRTGARLPLLVILIGLYVAVYLAVAGLLHVLTSPDAVAAAFVPDTSTASEVGAPRWPVPLSLVGPRPGDSPGRPTARPDEDNESRRRR